MFSTGDLSRYFIHVYKNTHDATVEQGQTPDTDIKMKPVSLSELLANDDPDSVKATDSKKTPENEPTFFVLDSHDSNMESDKTPGKREIDDKNIDIQSIEPVSLSELLADEDPDSRKATKSKKTTGQEPKFFVLDDLYTSTSSSSSSSSPTTKTTPLNTELPSIVPEDVNDTTGNSAKPQQELVEPMSGTNPGTDTEMYEQRGKKRKRSQSDDEEHFGKGSVLLLSGFYLVFLYSLSSF